MSGVCAIYTTGPATTEWPIQAFPRTVFRRWNGQRLTQAAKAWNFFERVESYDAAVRVYLSENPSYAYPTNSSMDPSIWYPIKSEGQRMLYKEGQALHRQACPTLIWTSQRNLSIPTTPLTDVRPQPCARTPGPLVGVGPCPA